MPIPRLMQLPRPVAETANSRFRVTLLYTEMSRILRELMIETYRISATLFRVMVPVLVLVKILEMLGGIVYIGYLLEPIMSLVGLPETMGLVWATTLVTNIYAGMLVFFNLAGSVDLTTAQVTVLGGMMLIAHTLPVEVRIAQKTGVRLSATLFLRLVGALLYGAILHQLYRHTDWLQENATIHWMPAVEDPTLWTWLQDQLESFLLIVLLIFVLLGLLRLLRALHIERLMIWLLQPFLRVMGIAPATTSITIVGMTLGLALGGGLLIREAKQGDLPAMDVFASMGLLALCHSIIEDTLLILLMGADISGVLWFRILFAILVMALLTRLLGRTSPAFRERFLVYRRSVSVNPSGDC